MATFLTGTRKTPQLAGDTPHLSAQSSPRCEAHIPADRVAFVYVVYGQITARKPFKGPKNHEKWGFGGFLMIFSLYFSTLSLP